MVSGARLEVRGARRLRSELKKLGADLGDLSALHRAVADHVVAVTDAPRRTGKLAGTVRGAGTRTAAVVRAGYAAIPYAGPVNYGWPARNIDAQPYLTDAVANSEPEWTELYTTGVEDLVDRTMEACDGTD